MTWSAKDEDLMDAAAARNGLQRLPGETIGQLWVRILDNAEAKMVSRMDPVSARRFGVAMARHGRSTAHLEAPALRNPLSWLRSLWK